MWLVWSVQVTVTSIRLTPAAGEPEGTAHERLNVAGTPETAILFCGLPVVSILAAVLAFSSSNLSCARLVAMVVYKPVWLACITVVAPIASPKTATAKMDIATRTSITVKPEAALLSLRNKPLQKNMRPVTGTFRCPFSVVAVGTSLSHRIKGSSRVRRQLPVLSLFRC